MNPEISYEYDVMKVAKSSPVDLQHTPTHFNFETVLKNNHNGADYYLTLGSIGEQRVDFFIWNSSFEVVEAVNFIKNNGAKLEISFLIYNNQRMTAQRY